MSAFRSILVRAPNWLGDCVMALPVFAALREANPSAVLVAACRNHLRACFESSPDVDEVVAAPSSGGWRSFPALWRDAERLRSRRFDAGLLLTNSFSTAFWMWRTGAARRIGYARDGRGLFLTDPVATTPRLLAAHQSDYYLHLTERLGADPRPRTPRLVVPEAGRAAAHALSERLGIRGGYVVLAPISAYGPVKDWPPARYAEVAAILAEATPVAITGVAADRDACEAIAGGRRNVFNLAGEVDLAGFFGLVEGAKVFLGGDSGGAHVAAALGIPTVVLFGITEPSRTRALGPRVLLLGRGGMETPDLKDPAVVEAAKAALANISVEDVLEAIRTASRM